MKICLDFVGVRFNFKTLSQKINIYMHSTAYEKTVKYYERNEYFSFQKKMVYKQHVYIIL